MSEVLFNYLTLKMGLINQIKEIYLAREYPRPSIYNIPETSDWLGGKTLLNDINFCMGVIDQGNSKKLLDCSLFNYLSIRFQTQKGTSLSQRIKNKVKKVYFFLANYVKITKFLVKVNAL